MCVGSNAKDVYKDIFPHCNLFSSFKAIAATDEQSFLVVAVWDGALLLRALAGGSVSPQV